MWVFPLGAAVVAFAFAAALGRRFVERRRTYLGLWCAALLMYGAASLAVAIGVGWGWSRGSFEVYWILGAVLNVPLLAAGEVQLLAGTASSSRPSGSCWRSWPRTRSR
jgi:hypothetical protein